MEGTPVIYYKFHTNLFGHICYHNFASQIQPAARKFPQHTPRPQTIRLQYNFTTTTNMVVPHCFLAVQNAVKRVGTVQPDQLIVDR